MFDRDDSGAVDWFEFGSFMNVLKGETNVGKTEVARQHRSDARECLWERNRVYTCTSKGQRMQLIMPGNTVPVCVVVKLMYVCARTERAWGAAVFTVSHVPNNFEVVSAAWVCAAEYANEIRSSAQVS